MTREELKKFALEPHIWKSRPITHACMKQKGTQIEVTARAVFLPKLEGHREWQHIDENGNYYNIDDLGIHFSYKGKQDPNDVVSAYFDEVGFYERIYDSDNGDITHYLTTANFNEYGS